MNEVLIIHLVNYISGVYIYVEAARDRLIRAQLITKLNIII